MVHPTPRAFPSEDENRQAVFVTREEILPTFNAQRTTVNVSKTVASTGFVPTYSGGTARDSHPLPLPRSHNVEGTLGDKEERCQVH